MSTKPTLFSGPAIWTLVAGLAIGAGSMYSVVSGHGGSIALAQPDMPNARNASFTKSESMAALKELDSGFANLAAYASPAVVLIKSTNKPQPGLTGMAGVGETGEGSGVIYRPDGYIVTNDHVVGGFDKVTVVLRDGREFPGKVTRAQLNDIAVVKIDANNLPTLPFADSSKVRPGEFAMAIGAPLGLDNSVTIGHVSALNRQNEIQDPMSGKVRFYPELIQTDAAINMGNSGGPLINVDGEVIGINSSIVSPNANGGGIGLGFAISSNQARLLADTLIQKGKITRSYLGLYPVDLKDYQKSQMHVTSGALVDTVEQDTPAGMAGIEKGDVVVRIGDIPVTDQIDLRDAMLKYAPGTTEEIEVIRNGDHKTFKVKLGEPPAQPVAQQLAPQINGSPFNFDGPDGMREFMKQFHNEIPQGQGSPETTPPIPPTPHTGPVRLGVEMRDIDDNARKQYHIPGAAKGVVVDTVLPGSIAEKVGLKAGDVIEKLGSTQITNAQSLRDAMSKVHWGDTQQITYTRWSANGVEQVVRDIQFK